MEEIGAEVIVPKTTSVEIKPRNPGCLRDLLKSENNERTKPGNELDYLIVFGQGPVLDESTKQKPLTGQSEVKEAAIAWMKNSARAAGELYLEGATKKIILTGGKTGGDYKGVGKHGQSDERMSEAELMKEILVNEYQIPESDIILEDTATNTLQNIPLSLNKIDSERLSDSAKPRIGLLGADFHIPRIRILADLFGISEHKSFSAEQIFRTIAYKLEEKGDVQSIQEARNMHQQLDALLSMNDDLSFPGSRFEQINYLNDFQLGARDKNKPSRSTAMIKTGTTKNTTLFEIQKGKEKEGFREKREIESYFTRGMIEVPEFWFGYVKFLNDGRLKGLIHQTDQKILDRFGLKRETPIDEIRKILEPYTNGDVEKGGKRLMLEKFYGIENTTTAKTNVGLGLDEKAYATHQQLTQIAEKLNSENDKNNLLARLRNKLRILNGKKNRK